MTCKILHRNTPRFFAKYEKRRFGTLTHSQQYQISKCNLIIYLKLVIILIINKLYHNIKQLNPITKLFSF